MVQKRALRCIYPDQRYDELIENLHVARLSERREKLCRDYLEQVRNESHKLHALLPEVRKVPYEIRSCSIYERLTAKNKSLWQFFYSMVFEELPMIFMTCDKFVQIMSWRLLFICTIVQLYHVFHCTRIYKVLPPIIACYTYCFMCCIICESNPGGCKQTLIYLLP